ncbi:HPr family phosphocarrier protein [Acidipropionibacterium acidipropionici]|uniref:HPr family phosphocarrier protein n=1 Tax=Acidipropionibacterium acidipropionici TaxID=1748 RepID=UPI000423BE97|nr:HPr family phosphocarrier protein [Acidipropionibacterium acidipropionici]ALN14030.1 phosphocarrier protein HPr [Acidipropionibacterium acidipropionici]APZ10207.1 phosphocarrier protein HPr [Acidipropionibacterium acidipropionici]
MPSRITTIAAASGLHARPAAMFVQAASKSGLAVTIGRPGETPVDARSILSVMGLGAKCGESVELTVEGDGADEVLEALVANLQTDPEA